MTRWITREKSDRQNCRRAFPMSEREPTGLLFLANQAIHCELLTHLHLKSSVSSLLEGTVFALFPRYFNAGRSNLALMLNLALGLGCKRSRVQIPAARPNPSISYKQKPGPIWPFVTQLATYPLIGLCLLFGSVFVTMSRPGIPRCRLRVSMTVPPARRGSRGRPSMP